MSGANASATARSHLGKMIRRIFIVAAIVISLQCRAFSQNDAVRVLASNGVRPAIQALTRPAEGAIARPLAAQFNTTTVLRQKIDAGEPFDVAVLTAEAIDGFIKSGKILPGSRADVGHVGIGVGVRSGAKKPDIRTVESMKSTLLAAKGISYAQDGASRPFIEKMFAELGIADLVKSKIVLRQGSDASMAAVVAGEAELEITLSSEIMQAPGMQLVGPLPDKFQNYVRFAAGVSTNSKNSDAAGALIKFLTNPKVAPTYKAKGIETGN
jgi:molybdate transport system substrate-binding protein